MTVHLNYYPDSGIAYDISKMLLVKLNPSNTWTELLTSPGNIENDLIHIKSCVDSLPNPKPEIFLFSFIPSNQNTTFLSFIISRLLEQGIHCFSISQLVSYLEDPSHVQNDLFEFYFGTFPSPKLDFDHTIRNNKILPDKLKVLLFGFVMYPQKFTTPLIDIVNTYYSIIKSDILSPLNKNVNLKKFTQHLIDQNSNRSFLSFSQNSDLEIAYSLSYCVPEYLAVDFITDHPFFISTEQTINKYNNSQKIPHTYLQLIELCHALSDKIRISILNSVLLERNITIDEISERIGLSITATKYHISLLTGAGLLSASRLHRKKVYSFDPNGFEKIKLLLDLMEKGDLT